MQVGCGFRVKTIKGNDYVYFWHYEEREGRSRQIQQYVGARRAAPTSRRLAELLDAYYARVSQDLHRERAGSRAAAASLR